MSGTTTSARVLSEYAETCRATATSSHGASMKSPPRHEAGAKPMACSAPSTPPQRASRSSRTAATWSGSVTSNSSTGGRRGQLAGRPLGQRQPPARPGEDDLGPLLLGQLGHGEAERGVGEHTGDEDALAVEKTHAHPIAQGARRYAGPAPAAPRVAGPTAPWRGPRTGRGPVAPAGRITSPPVKIGVLGSTGPAGSGLSVRLASCGYDVVIGSRSKYRAMEAAGPPAGPLGGPRSEHRGGRQRGAAAADVVVIATPWDAASSTALQVADQLKGKVVISMCNALAKVGHEFQPLVPPRGSVAATSRPPCPGRGWPRPPPRAGQGARRHRRAGRERRAGVLRPPLGHRGASARSWPACPRCGRSTPAQLSNAAPIEAFAAVLLQLNIRYKTRAAVKFTGINP